ncbi:hypothetical protein FNV43_RR24379 [Rhamnella rubrinervis]|uniref:EF-hand domain-containing protein n=1 Tax=Rhamnella rubrinervis TaxID=2594499 RepID=A0A8K0DLD7_9ROSA|nr:hypothetical protein FNV43_RR24379 [Rhamnella rubrinervis]
MKLLFLFGSANVRKHPLFQQSCELALTKRVVGGNGYISEQELTESIRSAIPDLNEDEVHQLFGLFGGDKDGRLMKDEFISCLKRIHC